MAYLIPRVRYKDLDRASALKYEKNRLLVDIIAATETEVLKRRYNAVVDQLVELKQSSLDDPLQILPQEIWIMVLQDVVAEDEEKINGLLSLTMVSPYWSDMILSTPDLWTSISIGDSFMAENADALAKLQMALTLSKDLFLHFDIYTSIFYWDSVFPFLEPHITRIRSFHCRGSTPSRNLHYIFRSLGCLPQLNRLSLPVYDDIGLETILDNIPNLTSIYYDPFTDNDMRHPNTRSLRHCTTRTQLSDIITALSSFKFLRSLVLSAPNQQSITSQADSTSQEEGASQEEGTNFPQVPSPLALRRFLSEHDETKLAVEVIKSSPLLTSLHIKIGSALKVLFELFDIAAALVHLVDLKVELTIPDERIEFPLRTNILTTRTLTLLIVSEENVESSLHNAFAFWNYLEGCTPLLSALLLSLSGNMTMLLQYINGMQHLRYLSLYMDPDVTLSNHALINSTIEDMDLDAEASIIAEFLAKFRLTGLLRLSYQVDWRLDPTSNAVEASLGDYSSIELLEWNDCPPIRDISGLRSLRRVVFSTCGMRVISNFCLQLIIKPETCPQLEHIEFDDCLPEWDWFILMLERRNLLPGVRASPLRTLVFSYSLSKILEKIIVDILHHRYPVRPSLEDLTFGSCLDLYLDPSMCVPIFK